MIVIIVSFVLTLTFPAYWAVDEEVSVKQYVDVLNEGDLPVSVKSISIGGEPCECYGFRAVDCKPFVLQPNETARLRLAFTPDLTVNSIEQWLQVDTLNNSFKVLLTATLPVSAGYRCSHTIPRPSWEPLLYYSLLTVAALMFIGIIFWALLEADIILDSSFVPMATLLPQEPVPRFNKAEVFDLRTIAAQDTLTKETPEEIILPPKKQTKNKSKMNNKDRPDFGLTSFLSSLPFSLNGDIKPRNIKERDSKIEEISSTTTESSEDISANVKETNPTRTYEDRPRKKKQPKPPVESNSNGFNNHQNNILVETGFEINTKCRGIKKIKVIYFF